MHTLGSAPTSSIRQLTDAEVEEVFGGAIPLAAAAVAIIVAAAIQRSREDSSAENDDLESDEGD